MEVKGSAVKSIADYVKKNHPDKYLQWIDLLPEGSKKIFNQAVLPSNWYPAMDGVIVPTEKIGEFFFNNDPIKAAWQSGRFNAEISLTGLYKFFVQAASPQFIISKAGRILSTYYSPSEILVAEKGDKWVKLHITRMGIPNIIVESRICGWIERAMEISGCKEVKVEILKSLSKGDKFTEINVMWK